jgi:arabinose-5-phosphate isomerase
MSINNLINKTKQLLNNFLDRLDPKPIESIVEMIHQHQGLIFLSGVGKSGMIAQKIAQTLTSTGTRAFYISPTDSMHGDLGQIAKDDAVFLISKSGESDELIAMLPSLRNKEAYIIAVVSNENSRLSKGSDKTILLPFEQELCPFDLAPTVSTTQQLIFGDLLAISLMQKKEISKDQFAKNHPAGRLGKRLTMKVKDLMLRDAHVPLCLGDQKLGDILVDFSSKRAGCMLVIDDGKKLKGIFTDGDLRRALQKHGSEVLQMKMDDLMIKQPRKVVSDMMAYEAMKYMEGDQKSPIMVLPVVELDDRVVGLVKLHDIIQSGV